MQCVLRIVVAPLLAFTAVLALGVASSAAAQTLGEVAKKEEARRKTIKTAGKVYTNDSLRGGSNAPPTSTPSAPGTAAQTPASNTAPAAPDKPATDSAQERKKQEEQWRSRIGEARKNLERARIFAEALQSRINALSTDFARRDDPVQRGQIAVDRQKALAELERVKKEIADSEKAIRDIEEEARKAGVPPGWLR